MDKIAPPSYDKKVLDDLVLAEKGRIYRLAEKWNLPIEKVREMCDNPEFIADFCRIEIAAGKIRFFTSVTDRLFEIVETATHATPVIRASRELRGILGIEYSKPTAGQMQVNVNVGLDNLIRKLTEEKQHNESSTTTVDISG